MFGRGVNNVAETPCGKLESLHASCLKGEARLSRQMRRLAEQRGRISRQHQDLRAKVQLLIGPKKTFYQPHPEESGPARNEQPLAAQFSPQVARVREHVVEIGGPERRCEHA